MTTGSFLYHGLLVEWTYTPARTGRSTEDCSPSELDIDSVEVEDDSAFFDAYWSSIIDMPEWRAICLKVIAHNMDKVRAAVEEKVNEY